MSEANASRPVLLIRRLAAWLLDTALVVLLLAMTIFCASSIRDSILAVDTVGAAENARRIWGAWLLWEAIVLPSPVALSLLLQVVLGGFSGRTAGKRSLRLCVIGVRRGVSGRAGYGRLFARWCLTWLPLVLLVEFFVLNYPRGGRAANLGIVGCLLGAVSASLVLSRSGRGVHDWVARTAVVPVSDLCECHPASAPYWLDRLMGTCKVRVGRASNGLGRWKRGGSDDEDVERRQGLLCGDWPASGSES